MGAEPFRTSIRIPAPAHTVFDYFVDPALLVRWMGDRAEVEPNDGGRYDLDINGVLVRGSIIESRPPKRLVLAWGHQGSKELPPGSSRVEIDLIETADGETIVELRHHGLPVSELDQHGVGWSHFLERLRLAASGRDPGPDPWAATGGGK